MNTKKLKLSLLALSLVVAALVVTAFSVPVHTAVTHNSLTLSVDEVCWQLTHDGKKSLWDCTQHNIITNQGLNLTRDYLFYGNFTTVSLSNVSYISVSTDATTPAAADTACTSEQTASGFSRAPTTRNLQTTATGTVSIGNYSMWVQYTATGTVNSIQKGCLWNSTSATNGVLFAETLFSSAVNVVSGDTLNVTWYIKAS